jgi:hypothetical protein
MRYIVLIIVLVFCSCENSYEKEESQAIRDITDAFIIKEHWNEVVDPPFPILGMKLPRAAIDSHEVQVVFCDTLSAFSEISSKKRFVFDNNRYNGADQATLRKIIDQEQFGQLPSRKISIKTVDLPKHFRNVGRSQLKHGDFYLNLKFSRICFDEKMENGLVVLDMGTGFQGNSKLRQLFPTYKERVNTQLTLIKKVDGKWKMVENNAALKLAWSKK